MGREESDAMAIELPKSRRTVGGAHCTDTHTLDCEGGASDVAIVLDARSKSVALSLCAEPRTGPASGVPVAGALLVSH